MALYKILSGVHRCVAAAKAGLTEIRAQVDVGGALGPVGPLPLADLYSPKPAIGRWDRGRDFLELVRLIADETWRDALDPVQVAAIPDRLAKYLTRVPDVVVNPA